MVSISQTGCHPYQKEALFCSTSFLKYPCLADRCRLSNPHTQAPVVEYLKWLALMLFSLSRRTHAVPKNYSKNKGLHFLRALKISRKTS